ncbi:MAG: hypothetical protein EZS28_030351 [Streblomastix strix]|uniref:Uncharacterized protein n=1 Tax=Streblomastix strix TaxID=222440 RepID=A0A5J4UUL8_9EUKA|nr:MAG: hypothetical protein EZS28_030351 [Streblomastix strix]
MVEIIKENNNERERVGRVKEIVGDKTEDEEQQSESCSGKDIGFRRKQGQIHNRQLAQKLEKASLRALSYLGVFENESNERGVVDKGIETKCNNGRQYNRHNKGLLGRIRNTSKNFSINNV